MGPRHGDTFKVGDLTVYVDEGAPPGGMFVDRLVAEQIARRDPVRDLAEHRPPSLVAMMQAERIRHATRPLPPISFWKLRCWC